MSRGVLKVCVFFLLSFLGGGAAESAPIVDAHLDLRIVDKEVFFGAPFVVEIVARIPSSSHLVWPSRFDFGPFVEEYSRSRRRSEEGDLASDKMVLTLLAFDTGRLSLSELRLRVKTPNRSELFIQSAAQDIEVRSGLSAGDNEIRVLAQPVGIMVRQWYWKWKFLLGALLVFVLGIWLWQGRAKTEEKSEAPARLLSPHNEAYFNFDQLEKSGVLSEQPRALGYLRMSEILRRYIARRFEIPAQDLTSLEIRSRLSGMDNSKEWLRALEHWLGACDLVKFANQSVSQEEALASLHSARVLVDRTKVVDREGPREIAKA